MSDVRTLPAVVDSPNEIEISVRDLDNPKSIFNLVPAKMRESILKVPDDYLNRDPDDLLKEFKKAGYVPSVLDHRLRITLWREYNTTLETGSHAINLTHVYGGLISRQNFYQSVMENKMRLAWILSPPPEYKASMEEALVFGIDRLREILAMPLVNKEGRPDAKMASVILEAIKMLDQRVKGSVIQKTQSLNVNVNTPTAPKEPAHNMDEIDKRLAELEQKATPELITEAKRAAASEVVEGEFVDGAKVIPVKSLLTSFEEDDDEGSDA